ncbi:Uncharacterised protein [Helicobacter fennelliae]|nr:Uncharacterised protein [Helicobacter fennelliae]
MQYNKNVININTRDMQMQYKTTQKTQKRA